jgi:hypothetical protein
MLKVRLWNKNLGTFVVDDDPDGINEVEQILRRSKKADGVTYEISLDLEFIKRAKSFIQTVYESEGIEGVIIVDVFEYDPNTLKWETYYTGKIALKRYIVTETKLKTNIEQSGFEIKVMNLTDVDVDIESLLSQGGSGIPATPMETIVFHAKKIIKTLNATPIDGTEFAQLDVFEMVVPNDVLGGTVNRDQVAYGQIDTTNLIAQELPTTFALPFGYLDFGLGMGPGAKTVSDYETFLNAQKDVRNNFQRIDESSVLNGKIKLTLKHSVYVRNDGGDVDISGEGALGHVEVHAWFEHRDVDDNIITLDHIGEWDMSGVGGNERIGSFETFTYNITNLSLDVGDKLYLYTTHRVWGSYEQPTGGTDGHLWHEFRVEADIDEVDGEPNTVIELSADTEFPETETNCVMVYEALNKCAQYMTDQSVALKSDFFGRTDSIDVYDEDGPGSLIAITNGANIRKLENAKLFINWTEIFESLSARHCLGWGIEKNDDGEPVLVVEPKTYFWDKDNLIIELDCVSDLEKSVAMEYYYNQVEIGYPKLDVGQLNGLDEFNTLRRWKLPITQTNSKLIVSSKYKTSGYEIETQRRLIGSTKDSKLDEANFMVKVVRDGGGFKTEKNENHPVVENLYDPASAYNLYFAPGRMIRAWAEVLASNVIKFTNKILTFTYGDGNFNLVSRETSEPANIAENGDVDISEITPIWEPEIYKFTYPIDRHQMKLIRQNPYGYIRFKDSGGNVKDGFILEVRHDPNQKMGDFQLLKVHRPTI